MNNNSKADSLVALLKAIDTPFLEFSINVTMAVGNSREWDVNEGEKHLRYIEDAIEHYRKGEAQANEVDISDRDIIEHESEEGKSNNLPQNLCSKLYTQ